MFSKNKKNNRLDYKGYQMKAEYEVDLLVIAKLSRVSDEVTEFGPTIETTEQKYIFEKIKEKGKIKYREVFTGFIALDRPEIFMLPYVTEVQRFTEYFPEIEGTKIPKLSLIWTLNDINNQKRLSKKDF